MDDKVVIVPADVDPGALAEFMFNNGPAPQGTRVESAREFMARGRVEDCDCEMIQCVCVLARQHDKDCKFRRALTCAIGIECEEHGRDVCPVCDPCTCSKP